MGKKAKNDHKYRGQLHLTDAYDAALLAEAAAVLGFRAILSTKQGFDRE